MALAYNDTRYEHIEFNETGTPFIAGTTMKVIELVLGKIGHGWSPEELHFQHPHLSMGHIHSALAYYWDHQTEMDQDIEQRLKTIQQVKNDSAPTPLIERLKKKGLL